MVMLRSPIIIGVVLVATSMSILLIDTQASVTDSSTLDSVRTETLASGMVPDTYLIERTGKYWESKSSDMRDLSSVRAYLADRQGYTNVATGKLTAQGVNFATLAESDNYNRHYLAALVIKQQLLSGEYETSNVALLKYHNYLASKYNTPDMLQEVQDEIQLVAGKMAPLAHVALELRDKWTLYGIVPISMHEAEPGFWTAVGDVGRCLDRPNADCTYHQSYLEKEGWKDVIKMTPEELVEWEREVFGESPSESQVYPQSWPFPPAFASSASYNGPYIVEWVVYSDCNDKDSKGEGCDAGDSASMSGYSTTMCKPERDKHMPGETGYFRITVIPTGTSTGVMAWLDYAQFGDDAGQGYPHLNHNGKAYSATSVSASSYAPGFGWYYNIECTTYAVQ